MNDDKDDASSPTYDPTSIDDPELRTGKHKTVIALPGYLGSINHYTRRDELKRELNEQFRLSHPDIDPSLTLSMIRNLKEKLVLVGLEEGLELSSIAMAFTHFERLILSGQVVKLNRRLVAACCFLLAAKANDRKGIQASLLDALACRLGVVIQSILDAEFGVFAALQFRLDVPTQYYLPHLERILAQIGYTGIQEYLGERMYLEWIHHHDSSQNQRLELEEEENEDDENLLFYYSNDDDEYE